MKKLALYKAAFEFAYANLAEANAVTLQQASLDAFKVGGFDQADLAIWNQLTLQASNNLRLIKNQALPSEMVAAKAIQAPSVQKIPPSEAPTPVAAPEAPEAPPAT